MNQKPTQCPFCSAPLDGAQSIYRLNCPNNCCRFYWYSEESIKYLYVDIASLITICVAYDKIFNSLAIISEGKELVIPFFDVRQYSLDDLKKKINTYLIFQ